MRNLSLKNLLKGKFVDPKFKTLITTTLASKDICTTDDLFSMQPISKYYGIGAGKARLIGELRCAIEQLSEEELELAEKGVSSRAQENKQFDMPAIDISLQDLLTRKLVDEKFAGLVQNLIDAGVCTVFEFFAVSDFSDYRGFGKERIKLIDELKLSISQIDEAVLGEENCYLPKECPDNATLAELVTKFLEEFCGLASQSSRLSKAKKNKLVSIQLAYLEGLSQDAILQDARITVKEKESIRVTLKGFVKMVCNIVLNGTHALDVFKKPYGIDSAILHPQFVERVKAAYNFANTCPTDVQFAQMVGSGGLPMQFLLDCFDKTKCSYIRSELKETFISPVEANSLTEGIGLVFDKLKEVVKPYHENELRSFLLKKTKAKSEIVDTICCILNSSSQFEKVDGGYQLSWKELKFAQQRVERILYEQQAPMQYNDIINEYRRRETIAQEKPDKTLKFESSSKIFNVKQRYWVWDENQNRDNINLLQKVKGFVAKNKKVSLDGVLEYARSLDVDVNARSIQAYVTECCYKTASGEYVYKSCRNEFKNERLYIGPEQLLDELLVIMSKDNEYRTVLELEQMYENTYGLLAGKKLVYNVCYNNEELFDKQRKQIGRGGAVMFRCKANSRSVLKDRKRQAENRPVRRKAEHIINITNEAINILQALDGDWMYLKDLVKKLEPLLPNGNPLTQIYKILKDVIFIQDDSKSDKRIKLNPEYYPSSMASYEAQEPETQEGTTVANESSSNLRKLADSDYEAIRDQLVANLKFYLRWIEEDGMPIVGFNVAWNRFVDICGVKNEGVNGAFQRTFRYLYKYLCGAVTLDEKFNLYDELNRRFEEYLAKITDDQKATLVDQIKHVQAAKILPPKEKSCNLTRYISNLIYYRNGPAHKKGNTPPDSYMTNGIYQALVLYLYVAQMAR